MGDKDEYYPWIYFGFASLFSIGYLLLLINGYYHYKYLEFISIGRSDLVSRLGFIAHTTGFLLFPTVILPIIILTLISQKRKQQKSKENWLFSFLGISIVGVLFYTGLIDNLIYGSVEKWIVGIILIVLSIILVVNKTIGGN